MKKLFNRLMAALGYVPKSECKAMEEELRQQMALNKGTLVRLNEKEELIYNFDKLIEYYNENQMNALAYKLINVARNARPDLLDRWLKRIKDAKSHPVENDSNIKS